MLELSLKRGLSANELADVCGADECDLISRRDATLARLASELSVSAPALSDALARPHGGGDEPAPAAPVKDAGEFWRSRRWLKAAGQLSLAAWASTVVAFLATIVAARALGPAGYGTVVLATAITAGIATFLDLSLEEAVVHHGAKAILAGDYGGLRSLLRTSLKLDIAVGVIVAALLAVFAAPLAHAVSKDALAPVLIQLGAIQTLISTIDTTTGASLLVVGRPQLRAFTLRASAVFRLAGTVVAVQLGGPEAVMIAYVLAALVGSAVQCVLAWRVAWRHWRRRSPQLGASPASARRLFSFGMHTSVSTSLASMQEYMFPVVLGALSGEAAVGIFRIALFPVTVADTVGGPLRLLVLPQQARMAAQARYRDLLRAMKAYTGVGLALGVPGCVAGWFALPWLIPHLYSGEFEGAVTPARILLIAALCHFAVGWSKSFYGAIGLPEFRSVITLFLVVINLSLLFAFGREGGTGAAVALSIGTVAASLTFVATAYRVLSNGGTWRRRSRAATAEAA